jgi:hypothetical protein
MRASTTGILSFLVKLGCDSKLFAICPMSLERDNFADICDKMARLKARTPKDLGQGCRQDRKTCILPPIIENLVAGLLPQAKYDSDEVITLPKSVETNMRSPAYPLLIHAANDPLSRRVAAVRRQADEAPGSRPWRCGSIPSLDCFTVGNTLPHVTLSLQASCQYLRYDSSCRTAQD